MIGLPEIAILLVILLVVFWRYLPKIGRKAGTGARELKEGVQEVVGDKTDPKTLARHAGKGVREAREFRDALTGKEPAEKPKPAAEAEKPKAAEAPEPAAAAPEPAPEPPKPAPEPTTTPPQDDSRA